MDVGGGAKTEIYNLVDERDAVKFIKLGRLRRDGQVKEEGRK